MTAATRDTVNGMSRDALAVVGKLDQVITELQALRREVATLRRKAAVR